MPEPSLPVVLISIDGLRADALAQADIPAIHGLQQRGASAPAANSVMPSVTLPCHLAMLRSISPASYGITGNTWAPDKVVPPGLAEAVKAGGLRAGFFQNWEPLRDLSQPLSLHVSFCQNDCETNRDSDHLIAAEAAARITSERLFFAFVYLGTLDVYGHKHGFGSVPYLEQLAHVDGAVAHLLSALPDAATVLLTSDHGGHGRHHGTDLPDDMLVLWIIAGPTVRPSHTISAPVGLLDVAPTLAHLLGLPQHSAWEGRIIQEAFA